MSSMPGPKPWIEPLAWPNKIPYAEIISVFKTLGKDRPPRSKEELKKRAIYAEAMRNRVSIGIFRGTSSISYLFGGDKEFWLHKYYEGPCSGLAVGEYHIIASARGCLREPDIDGLESYVQLICYSDDQLNGVYQDKFYKDNLQRKAGDDHSPENCYIDRAALSLKTPPNTPEDEQVIINCSNGSCWAIFSFYRRRVEVNLQTDLNDDYNKINHYPKNPMRNEVYTELSRWREKVDVARKRVDSFVVEQAKT